MIIYVLLICPLKEPEFLAGRQARIIYKGKHAGTFGIVHPEVLAIAKIILFYYVQLLVYNLAIPIILF